VEVIEQGKFDEVLSGVDRTFVDWAIGRVKKIFTFRRDRIIWI